MVEGPGCTLNGEKIRAKVQKGQKVKEIRGSLITTKDCRVVSCFSLRGHQKQANANVSAQNNTTS